MSFSVFRNPSFSISHTLVIFDPNVVPNRQGDRFRSEVSGREFKISSNFTCDSSGVVYLLGWKVCSNQYLGSTFTLSRVRFTNYKSASRRFLKGEVVTQAELFEHFSGADHHGFFPNFNFPNNR